MIFPTAPSRKIYTEPKFIADPISKHQVTPYVTLSEKQIDNIRTTAITYWKNNEREVFKIKVPINNLMKHLSNNITIVRNLKTDDFTYNKNDQFISCKEMIEVLYSTNLLEEIPFYFGSTGPFEELDKLLHKDRSVVDKNKRSRFSILELPNESDDDSDNDSSRDTTETHHEGEGSS